MMRKVWNLVWGVKSFYLGDNLFLAQFFDSGDKYKVFHNSPWTFDKSLVLFQNYDGDLKPSYIKMGFASFWVRIYDLPLKGMTGEIVKRIGASIGIVEDIDLPENSPS